MSKKAKSFNEDRQFGVEIEYTLASRDRSRVREALVAKGLVAHVEGYNHETRPYWKLITDASCGYELVSPILKGRDGLNQLKLALEALTEVGAKVDKKCGIHIHHDINDLNIKQIANVFASYIKYESVIDSFMPNSRRGNNNQYCRSLHTYGPEQMIQEMKNVTSIEDIYRIYPSRYYKLNALSYIRYGTLEFRQHAGSLSYEKIYNWILLTQQIIENGKTLVHKTYDPEKINFHYFRNNFGLIPTYGADAEIHAMLKWFRKRADELAA